MPALAALLGALFSGILQFFAQYVSKKLALGLTAATMFTTLTAGMYVAMSLALNGLAASMPSFNGMELALYVAAPSNLPGVISAVLSADATFALYAWNVKLLRLVSAS